ncbi:MAG: T9SS type A sorting domain-containing protein [Flavobacteriia bacterium]|nr:T9SS type A sorting domain-containing protein [Flavobacteriia bacterium]
MKNLLTLVMIFIGLNTIAQWQNTNPVSPQMNCVAAYGTNVFAGRAGGGVEGSLDSGTSWTNCCYNGMTYPYIWSIMIDDTNVIAATGSGVYLSIDCAENWIPISDGLIATTPFDTAVYTVLKNGNDLYAGTAGQGIFFSANYGGHWNAVNNGLTNQNVRSLAADNINIYAGTTGGGVFISDDSGSNWTASNTGLTNGNITSITIDGTNIYAGTSGGGIFLSSDNGNSWTAVNNGLLNLQITALISKNGNIYAGTNGGGVYMSIDNGANWYAENNGLTNSNISGLSISGNTIYASIYMGGIWKRALSEIAGITELGIQYQLNVYPNPMSSVTTLNTNIPLQNATLKIENYLGQTVRILKNLQGQIITLHRENLQTGLYVMRLVENNKMIATRKIIITD